jgi:two-component system, NarL family, nitrate/nitrite response regulator NarL
MSERLRVAIIDDHPMLREGIKATIGESAEFEVVAIGGSLADAIEVAQNASPEVMLIDINIPGNGFEAMKAVSRAHPRIKIVFFTASERLDHVKLALDMGSMGYMIKGASSEELYRCLRCVKNGKRYITPELAARVLGGETDPGVVHNGHPVKFTGREKDVVVFLAAGLTNKEIADKLDLSEKTVKHHMSVIMEKLGVRNRVEAALAISRMPELML